MKTQRTRIGAYALIHASGRILLCRIAPELVRWAGAWTLPGGGIDFGEPPAGAMVREVLEETGLVVEPVQVVDVDSICDRTGSDDYHGIRIIYEASVLGGSLRHETTGSTDRCEWHPLHQPLSVPLGDLAEVGIELARRRWPA
jgi:ADP-ribose pyrophosphatase YjhB (NUDIX family)